MARRQPGGKRSKGKKNRKHGRNKESCNLYRQQNRRERNKARRLARHLRHHPTDNTARAALRGLPMDGALTPSGVTYPHEPQSPDLPCDRPSGALAAPAPRSPGDYPLGGDGVCGGGSGDPTRDSGVWAHTAPGHLLGHRVLKLRKRYYNSDWRLPLDGAALECILGTYRSGNTPRRQKKTPANRGQDTRRQKGYLVFSQVRVRRIRSSDTKAPYTSPARSASRAMSLARKAMWSQAASVLSNGAKSESSSSALLRASIGSTGVIGSV